MSFIRYFDFFDVRFHFYTNSEPSNRSNFGGVMSIIFVIVSIIVFIFLEYDELRRINPLTSKSEIPEIGDRTIQLDKEHIWIPWRIVTYEKKFINHSGLLFPIITLVQGKKNNNNEMILTKKNLKYNLCSKTSMVNNNGNFKLNTNLNELYCIDEKEIPFGGSWYSDSINFLEINLYLCKDGIDYNPYNENCTNISKIVKAENNTNWLFEFYYPLAQFEPTNKNSPMSIIYRRYYYLLSSQTNKIERIYLQQNILNDDMGIITSRSKNHSFWGISSFYGDNYFSSKEKDLLSKISSSRLYSLVIYLDSGLIYYTRYYKKLFAIFAESFPYINIIYYVLKTITKFIKLSLTKKLLAELIFENKPFIKGKMKENSILSPEVRNNKFSSKNINNINATINNYINNGKYYRKELLFDDSEVGKISNVLETQKANFEKELNLPQSNKNCPIERRPRRRTLETFVKRKFSSNIKVQLQKKRQKKSLKELLNIEDYLFPFLYYLLPYHPKSSKYDSFIIVTQFMSKLYDISSHVILFKHFNIIKNIFLEERNLLICNKKINIQNEELMKEVKNEVQDFTKEHKYYVFFKALLEYDY